MEPCSYFCQFNFCLIPPITKPLTYRSENLDYLVSRLCEPIIEPLTQLPPQCNQNVPYCLKYRSHIVSKWCCSIYHLSPSITEPLAYCTKETCYPVPNLMAPIREPLAYCTKRILDICP